MAALNGIDKETFIVGMRAVFEMVWRDRYEPLLKQMLRDDFGNQIDYRIDQAIRRCQFCGCEHLRCAHCGAPKTARTR